MESLKPENDEQPILVSVEPPLGWVVINRPAASNALTMAMWDEAAAAISSLAADEQIRVIILRGAGDKSFIAGADIAELQTQLANPELSEAGYQFTLKLLETIATIPKPVIAMINGHCLGGGVLLALMCDLRIASEQAQFGIPAARLGVAYPPEQGVARLVQMVGLGNAAEMLLTGRMLDASEAQRMGLVNRLAPSAELAARTREYALLLAQNAPLVLTAHKLALQSSRYAEPPQRVLQEAVARCYTSADCREGLAAFLAKRPPQFTDK